MAQKLIDISCRDTEYTVEVTIHRLPVNEGQLKAALRFPEMIRERKGTSVVIYLEDEEQEEEVPQAILLAESHEGFYMELAYSMADFEWEHPLLLANDHLTEEEVAEVLKSILCDCTDELPIVYNCFGEVSSRVFPEKEKGE